MVGRAETVAIHLAVALAEVFLADDVEFLARAEVGLRGGDVFGSDAVGGDEDDVGLANALGVIVGNGEVGEVDVFGNGAFDDDVDEVAGKAVADDEDFARFKKDNEDWLSTYAAFCILRDKYHTARFTDWKEDSTYSRRKVETLVKQREAEYICWVQYMLHIQLKDAAEYAKGKGGTFMADIPIGISADSVEAWSEAELFNLDMQSGSMPDKGNSHGQNWCFPTYNWDAMMRDGCRWWQNRLHRMEQYFGAVRIDHVLGFFRIWEIPRSQVDARTFFTVDAFVSQRYQYARTHIPPSVHDQALCQLEGAHKDIRHTCGICT